MTETMQRSPLENGPNALPNRLQRLSASPGGLSDLMGERTGQNGENLKNKNSDRLALKKTTQSNKSRVSSAQGDEFQSQNSFDNGNKIGPSSGQRSSSSEKIILVGNIPPRNISAVAALEGSEMTGNRINMVNKAKTNHLVHGKIHPGTTGILGNRGINNSTGSKDSAKIQSKQTSNSASGANFRSGQSVSVVQTSGRPSEKSSSHYGQFSLLSDLGIDDNEEDNSLKTINSVHTTGILIGSDAVEVRESLVPVHVLDRDWMKI